MKANPFHSEGFKELLEKANKTLAAKAKAKDKKEASKIEEQCKRIEKMRKEMKIYN